MAAYPANSMQNEWKAREASDRSVERARTLRLRVTFPALLRLVLSIALSGCWIIIAGAAHAADAPTVFQSEIGPLLTQRCVACHRDGQEDEALFSLQRRSSVAAADVLTPGDPANSRLLEVLEPHGNARPEMPKDGRPLAASEVEKIRNWIAAGADWPEDVILQPPQATTPEQWWAIQPIRLIIPPTIVGERVESTLDTLWLAALNESGLSPSPEADRAILLRRVTLDLTGLPPTPEELERFVHDGRPDAYQRVVDRLLADPAYGERWGRHWLDVVRFGESRGFERNEIITNLWPYRDYVIRAFNRDLPFDQFALEQLAGDALWPDEPEKHFASAYLVAGPYDDVGNQDAKAAAQIRANTIDEIIRTTSEAFLGVTLGCARCHDHKFDPLTQADYYAWYATFAGVRHGQRDVAPAAEHAAREQQRTPWLARQAELQARRTEITAQADPAESQSELFAIDQELERLTAQLAQVPPLPQWWIGTREPASGPFHVFVGGDPQRSGEEVQPKSIAAFASTTAPYALSPDASEAARREALARWLFRSDQPLVARVLANRLWQYHFGRGLVETSSDFGSKGAPCSHPDLLDYLAGELIRNGWQLKPLHRAIVSSRAYRQASTWREDAAEVDAEARWLWRFPPRRMSAEELRDTMLIVAGQLNRQAGGPGFRLYEYQQDNVATYVPLTHHGRETYRRAVYHHNARSAPVDLINDFDAPDCTLPSPKRPSTTTPLQALTLLNHQFTLDISKAWSQSLEQFARDSGAIIDEAFRQAYGRKPSAAERDAALDLISAFGTDAMCRALLNSSEFAHVQ